MFPVALQQCVDTGYYYSNEPTQDADAAKYMGRG